MTFLDLPGVHSFVGTVVATDTDDRRPSADLGGAAGWRPTEQIACLFILFLLGWRLMLKGGLTFGACAALLLCPVWMSAARRYRHATLLFACTGSAYVSGMLLTAFAANNNRYASFSSALEGSSLWIGTIAAVGVVLWARTVASPSSIGIAFGSGVLLHNISHPDVLAPTNPWKFIFSIPVSIMALGIVSHRRRQLGSLIVLLALAGVSAALDTRSLFGSLLLAAVLVGSQLRPRRAAKPVAWGWTLVLMCGLAVAIYNLATSLMLDGALGSKIEQRSRLQAETAGSVLLGARPELGATLALIRHNPAGFGVGVAPNIFDVMVAKSGMVGLNYDPDNGYVDHYMFGGHVELHSAAGDLWAMFGLSGLAMAGLITLLAVRGVSHSAGARDGNGLLIFCVCNTLWNLPFSPLFSSIPTLILMLGFALSVRRGRANFRESRLDTSQAVRMCDVAA